MSGSLTFMYGRSRHNDWIKGSVDGWEWSTRGAGYGGDRDFFSVHWQIDLPKGFFVEWEIDTPKNHPHVSPVAVLLHVASPRHEADPVLKALKREVLDAFLTANGLNNDIHKRFFCIENHTNSSAMPHCKVFPPHVLRVEKGEIANRDKLDQAGRRHAF